MDIVLGDSYKIKDYTCMTSMNEDYWVLSTLNMSYLDLPKQYIKEIYVIIESFLSSRPTFCPTLVQELMATNDGVYCSLQCWPVLLLLWRSSGSTWKNITRTISGSPLSSCTLLLGLVLSTHTHKRHTLL